MTERLVARVAALLDRLGAPYALVGAGALAVHGVARSTFDVDLSGRSTPASTVSLPAPRLCGPGSPDGATRCDRLVRFDRGRGASRTSRTAVRLADVFSASGP